MEGPVLSGKAISSSPYLRHSAAWAFTGPLFLWRKRLLPGRLSDLAAIPRSLSNHKATRAGRWSRVALRLLLGCVEADGTACFSRIGSVPSARADEKVEGHIS